MVPKSLALLVAPKLDLLSLVPFDKMFPFAVPMALIPLAVPKPLILLEVPKPFILLAAP